MATIVRRRKLGMSSVKGICEKSKKGIQWCRNDKGIPDDELFIRWGCTSPLPKKAKVINKSKAIHQVNDKAEFRRALNEAGLCPSTWFHPDDVPNHEIKKGVIVRKKRHAQGRDLFYCDTRDDLFKVYQRIGRGYISSHVAKQREYRVFVIQGRAVAVAKKTPGNPDEIAWNVAKGGRFDSVLWGDWPLKAVKKSIEAFNLSELDFGGVDVMIDGEGECYILEINSAPSLTSPYRQTCMAKGLDWMIEHGTKRIPIINKKGDYKKFIHPAMYDRAIVDYRGEG
ncbi:MAG: putative alpha-L-glutamate ligase [Prokaryotic dsDNA virus sp.]|nr:MAG: putative alpha-L-glutamate ligase [Prokaryotic dsDNA virus sp.]|tara:strand:- start:30990 stop:31838 length:849 start_codon:yes stop_codon:yes gene_type:complete